VFEQEHGRGGFAGKVSHTYHLYPPTNWLPDETKTLEAFAPDWESPLRPIGGIHHALGVAPPEPARDVYRGMARIVANATSTMNVTAPRAPMDYFFEHHSASMVFFVHEGRGTLETTFGPIEYRPGDFLIIPKGVTHRFEPAAGPQYFWMYESFAGDPEKSESPTTGRFLTHSASDYRFPRSLDTRNESGRFEIVSKLDELYARRVHPTHPFDVIGWRGEYLPYKFAVEDVRPAHRRPLARAALGPHDLQAARLLPVCLHRALRSRRTPCGCRSSTRTWTTSRRSATTGASSSAAAAWWVPAWSRCTPSACRTVRSRSRSRRSWTAPTRGCTGRSGSWPTSRTPTQVSEYALGLSRRDYMGAWGAYTTDERFTYRADRLAEARALGERLADARDSLRPPDDESRA
jgi:hypothetical protein